MLRQLKQGLMGLKQELIKLHKDEEGADMIEYILVIAAIALPLLAVVIWFWKDISKWADTLWKSAKGETGKNPNDLTVE